MAVSARGYANCIRGQSDQGEESKRKSTTDAFIMQSMPFGKLVNQMLLALKKWREPSSIQVFLAPRKISTLSITVFDLERPLVWPTMASPEKQERPSQDSDEAIIDREMSRGTRL